MSISLSRRDAIKGMMAVSAAVAATPYLANLAGAVQASPIKATPVQSTQASSVSAMGNTASNDGEPLVLVIRNDIVHSFQGLQEIRVQDAGLAGQLKSVMNLRLR